MSTTPGLLPPLRFMPLTPLSALDPFMPVLGGLSESQDLPERPAMSRSASESSTSTDLSDGVDFFRSVILDSPMRGCDPAGSTQPLRVKKKAHATESCVRNERPRQSEMSLPRSPRSATIRSSFPIVDATLHRYASDASNTTSAAHRSISHLMLNLPLTPLPAGPARPLTPPASDGESRSPSLQSKFHLGLGRFGTYDQAIHPGLSPLPSPPRCSMETYREAAPVRSGRGMPDPPLTPSRAPPKAAALLGASQKPMRGKRGAEKTLKAHLRPSPGRTPAEIERFFGEVPGKASKLTPAEPLKPSRHIDQERRLWLDVEEEQEFAWLMTGPTGIRQPDHDHRAARGKQNPRGSAAQREVGAEDAWGLTRFTSVLGLPTRGSNGPHISTASNANTGQKPKRQDESFLDFGKKGAKPKRSKGNTAKNGSEWIPAPPTQASRLNVGDHIIIPPPRTTSRACSDHSSSGPPPLIRQMTPPSPKSRPRPPPLTLTATPPRKNLPILTPNTPPAPSKLASASKRAPAPVFAKAPELAPQTDVTAKTIRRKPVITEPLGPPPVMETIRTPFAHPRKAPIPNDCDRPPMPVLGMHSRDLSSNSSTRKASFEIYDLEPITYPSHLAIRAVPSLPAPAPTGRQVTRSPPLVLPAMMDDQPVSYFEPATPLSRAAPPVGTASCPSSATEKNASTGTWLKIIDKTRSVKA